MKLITLPSPHSPSPLPSLFPLTYPSLSPFLSFPLPPLVPVSPHFPSLLPGLFPLLLFPLLQLPFIRCSSSFYYHLSFSPSTPYIPLLQLHSPYLLPSPPPSSAIFPSTFLLTFLFLLKIYLVSFSFTSLYRLTHKVSGVASSGLFFPPAIIFVQLVVFKGI